MALLWNSDTQLRSILVKYWPCCEAQTHSWGAFWWNIGLVVKLRKKLRSIRSGEILALLWSSDTQLRSILVKYWPCCETQTHSWGAFWWNIGLVVKLRHTVEEHSGEILALLWNSDTQLRSILVKYWPCCETQTHSWGTFWWNIGLVVKLRHTVEELLVKYWPCCEAQTHSWGAFWWNIGLVVKLRKKLRSIRSGEILALLWNSDTQLRSILVKYWPCCEAQTHSWGAFWWNIGLVVKLRHTVEEHSSEILALLWNSDTQLRNILVKYWPCCEAQTHSWGAFWWNIGLVVKLRHTVEEHSGEILALLWN